MSLRGAGLAAAALVAVFGGRAGAVRDRGLVRIEVVGTTGGSVARCTSDVASCEVGDAATGACDVDIRACVDVRARGVARLQVRGTPGVADRLVGGVRDLPGALARPRGARFVPPLGAGCMSLAASSLQVGSSARVVLFARTARGRRTRARLSLACTASTPVGPKPPPPPSPSPPPPGPPAALRFERVIIDPTGGEQLTSDVAPGDIDGDGRPDVVVSGFEHLLWYRNPDWSMQVIADGGYGRGGKTLVRDMDGDGRLDVVTGTLDPAIAMIWFRNTGAGWERYLLSDAAYCHDLVFGDLDGDGRAEALCLDQYRGEVLELVAPANPFDAWTVKTIDPDENSMGSAIGDVDRDGRVDVVAGRAWYRNEGDGTWTRHPYTDIDVPDYDDHFHDYAKVSLLDLDGDGRLDIFATLYAETPAGEVVAFLSPPDPVNEPWTPVVIDPGPLFGVHSQVVAAFDGTSRPQIMVGETGIGGFGFGVNPSPQLYIYRLLGAAADPAAWERTTIDTVGTHEAQGVDLDGDGLTDLVGHEENTDVIARDGAVQAWFNETGR
jgi:VCBS repeat protein